MPQSLCKMYIHVVFSTKNRHRFIQSKYEDRLYAYMRSICEDMQCPIFEIGGVEDHVHILLEQSKNMTVSKLVGQIKAHSSRWIKKQFSDCHDFTWQGGYGAFSVGQTNLEQVRNYIQNQKEHHKKYSFKEEFLKLIKRAGLEFDENHLWE